MNKQRLQNLEFAQNLLRQVTEGQPARAARGEAREGQRAVAIGLGLCLQLVDGYDTAPTGCGSVILKEYLCTRYTRAFAIAS